MCKGRDRNPEITSLSCDLAFVPWKFVTNGWQLKRSAVVVWSLLTCSYLQISLTFQFVFSRVLEIFGDEGTGRMAGGWLHSTFLNCIRLWAMRTWEKSKLASIIFKHWKSHSKLQHPVSTYSVRQHLLTITGTQHYKQANVWYPGRKSWLLIMIWRPV